MKVWPYRTTIIQSYVYFPHVITQYNLNCANQKQNWMMNLYIRQFQITMERGEKYPSVQAVQSLHIVTNVYYCKNHIML